MVRPPRKNRNKGCAHQRSPHRANGGTVRMKVLTSSLAGPTSAGRVGAAMRDEWPDKTAVLLTPVNFTRFTDRLSAMLGAAMILG